MPADPNKNSDLLLEAWKLRFSDPEREARFDAARLTSAKVRVRITVGIGLVVLAGMGLVGFLSPTVDPELQLRAWTIRYAMCVPLWLMFFFSTWSRYFSERMDEWLSPGIPLTCALFTWESITLAALPGDAPVPVLLGVNVLPMLMVSALAIPFRFRWLVSAVILSVILPTTLVAVWQPSLNPTDLVFGALNMVGFGLCILVAGWWREAMERRLFAQRELFEHANLELTRLNHQKNAFLAMAAHDLRAPLSVNRSLAEVLLTEPEPSREERKDALVEIAAASDRMLELVSNFLDVHALESESIPAKKDVVDLSEALATCIRRNLLSARRKGQQVKMDPPHGPVSAFADASLLAQILDNLITNALKFSPRDSIIRVRVDPAVNGFCRIEVEDSGPGFTQEDFSKAFRAFTRLSATPTDGEESLGLGLSLCKRFTEAMGGRIEIRNAPTGGAVVSVSLPAEFAAGR